MDRKITYELSGHYVATLWSGSKVPFKIDSLVVDSQEFSSILECPLQDYLQFGVQEIDYVHLLAYRQEEWQHNDYMYMKRSLTPIVIEHGTLPDDEELQKLISSLLS